MATYGGIVALNGAQTVLVDLFSKSVTVAAISGSVNVTLTGAQCVGTSVPVPAGTTMTWSVDISGENLHCAFQVTGVAGTQALVAYTR